ncbi:MAG TPA: tetratricopeptide repeat protein [Gemmatimonadales bacterium]
MKWRPDRPRWLQAVRRHDRALAWGYLGAVALLLLAFALPPIRRRGLTLAERALRVWEHRWIRRVELGEGLVRAGRYQEAATYLARLDRQFPARDARHALDKERERLLVALGRSYAELGSKQRALETYQRLVTFDPRNYRNYYALALLSNRLLAGWAPAPEARDAFLQVLRINPSHLPSVRGAIAFYSARGEFAEVVRLYQNYLDAYLLQELTVRLGDDFTVMSAPADGQFHDYELRLAQPAGRAIMLSIETGGFSLGLERAVVLGPLRAGVAGAGTETELPLDQADTRALTRTGQYAWRAEAGNATLALPVFAQRDGIAHVHLRLRLFKPTDPATWGMVVPAYRNRLDAAGLAAAQARTLLLPTVLAADSVLLRPWWATEGLGVGADDTRY